MAARAVKVREPRGSRGRPCRAVGDRRFDELRELIAEGQERGYLTQEEVAVRLAEFDLSADQLRSCTRSSASTGSR